MLKLLFIEDEPEILDTITKDLSSVEYTFQTCTSFEDASAAIDDFIPDVVVLDLLDQGGEGNPSLAGDDVVAHVWNSRFRPIIIYSAQPDLLEERYKSHPFVESVKKGRGSPTKVIASLKKLKPHVEAIQNAENDVRREFSLVLRDVAPDTFCFYEEGQRDEALVRAARRRLAALMDEGLGKKPLKSWEQYLYPPVCSHLLLGDILREQGCAAGNPSGFCVVLTPSCDLACSGTRPPKVSQVLAAKCCAIGNEITADRSGSKLKDHLRKNVLSRGFTETMIPLPCLEGRIPTMAANLRELTLISHDDIGRNEDKAYLRVASLDSPFREVISWAYTQMSGRPGLPDRDFEQWSEEIANCVKSEGQ